jgi:hypothetical protein
MVRANAFDSARPIQANTYLVLMMVGILPPLDFQSSHAWLVPVTIPCAGHDEVGRCSLKLPISPYQRVRTPGTQMSMMSVP